MVRSGEMGSNRFSDKDVQLEIVSGRYLTILQIIKIKMAAGKKKSGKRKSSDEGRTHSCALLRRPTTLSWWRKARLGEVGSKYLCVVKIIFEKNTCNLKLLEGGILQ